MNRFILFWLLCLISPFAGAASVPLRNSSTTYDLFRASTLLEVKPGQVSIDSLLQTPERYRFAPTRNNLITPYDRQRAYWFQVTVTNQTPDVFYLHAIYSGTERVVVYEVADKRVVATHHLGRLEPVVGSAMRASLLYCPLQVRQGQTHTLYVYTEGLYTTCQYFYGQSATTLFESIHNKELFYGLYYGCLLMIVVYSLMLFVRLRDQDTLWYAFWVTFIGMQLALYRGYTREYLWIATPEIERYATVVAGMSGILHVLFSISFLRLRQQALRYFRVGIVVIGAYLIGIALNLVTVYAATQTSRQLDLVPQIAILEGIFSVVVGVITYRRGFRPALFYVIGNLIFFVSIFAFLLYAAGELPHSFWTYNSIHIGSGIEILLFTLALTYKVNLLKRQQEEAVREQLRLAEANEQLVQQQKAMLEAKVRQRTEELNVQKEGLQAALTTLQKTQSQLIQKEKMASLGELVAGIAHEIQNPLNFVNNFAELSVEMIVELKDEMVLAHQPEALQLADELVQNLQKIQFHGKRADSIVRSMLQHSQSSKGVLQPTNLNALAVEYLQIAYQGWRAKDKSFNTKLVTSLDPTVGLVDLVPQEIARVLLNLYTNAFYATHEKEQQCEKNGLTYFHPQVDLSTHRDNGRVEVRIRDNGTGIPKELLDKIYQPFFTTKPSGQGVGLGLSLSYDVITKGHGGQLDVRTEPGEFTEFVITLDAKT